jgi:hypothetical protein
MFRNVIRIRSAVGLAAFLAVGCDDDAARPRGAADTSVDAGSTRDSGHSRRDAAPESETDAPVPDASGDTGKHDGADAGKHDGGVDAGKHDGADAGKHDGGVDAGKRDSSSPSVADSGASDAADAQAGEPPLLKIPGWSVRKRILAQDGGDIALEQVLMSFVVADPGRTRLVHLGASGVTARSFDAPSNAFLTDFCVHPSGELSALLVVGDERSVSLVRLDASLSPLSIIPVHDPEVPNDLPPDPPSDPPGPTDLFVNGLATDAARIAPVGEDVAFVVYTTRSSVIAYRSSYANAAWSTPVRTLVEPPQYVTAFLPIGGSFDTFGAMVDWYRAYLDTDEDGNAFVAVWAHPLKIKAHVNAFHDGLAPLHTGFPHVSDSDVILTRLDRDGKRAWSRVLGTDNEDEPYAIRAGHGQVAVVGRSRRFPGFDNTAWDAFFSVSTTSGTLVGSRAVPLDASSIFLAIAARSDGSWVVGGSDGWSQNPEGLSIGDGRKLLLELANVEADPVRRTLPVGPRHNEVRTVSVDGARIRYGGHEDGPSMHTGDADHSLIRATGVIGTVAE